MSSFFLEDLENNDMSVKDKVQQQLEFVLNNFNNSNFDLPHYMGINPWKVDLNIIKQVIEKEEPRIKIDKIEEKNKIIYIDFSEGNTFAWSLQK